MQIRGEGERVKSLNVRGDEIYRTSVQSHDPVLPGAQRTWYGVLLMHTSKYGSSVLITSPRRTSNRFASGLPCTRFVTSLAILGSSSTAMTFLAFSRILTVMLPVPGPTSRTIWTISAAWYALTLLETDITLLEICLIHNCLSYPWIFEDMLADVRLHLKDMVGGRAFAPVAVRAAVSSAIALPSGSFGHDALRITTTSNVQSENERIQVISLNYTR